MTNNEAELWALHQGLQIVVRNGYMNLEIEGDSQITVEMLRKLRDGRSWQHVTKSWRTSGIIQDIGNLLNRIEYKIINHVRRTGNKAADLLANWGSEKADRRLDVSWSAIDDEVSWRELQNIIIHDHNEANARKNDNHQTADRR